MHGGVNEGRKVDWGARPGRLYEREIRLRRLARGRSESRVDWGTWPTGLSERVSRLRPMGLSERRRVDWGAWHVELSVRGRVGWDTCPEGTQCERESRLRHPARGSR